MSRRFAALRRWLGRHKARIKKVATVLFICLVVGLLVRVGLTIEWGEVADAVLDTPVSSLWKASLVVAVSYTVYSCFDMLGKWYTGHELPWWRTMMAAFISYAFTMNFSAALGGLAMRLRLYGKQGLNPGQVMRVMGLSIATNWMGYSLLAGGVFAMGAVKPPASWEVSGGPLRLIGGVMIVVALGYVLLCAFSRRRSWTIGNHIIELPQLRIAVLQLALAMVNWALMGLVVHLVMPGAVPYTVVLGTLLLSAGAGAVAHIPGGLGVTEYVFITLLSPEVPRYQVLGAVLVYRVLYYVAPVLLAGVWYLVFEARSPATVSRGTKIA